MPPGVIGRDGVPLLPQVFGRPQSTGRGQHVIVISPVKTVIVAFIAGLFRGARIHRNEKPFVSARLLINGQGTGGLGHVNDDIHLFLFVKLLGLFISDPRVQAMIPCDDFDGFTQRFSPGVFHRQLDAQEVLFIQKSIGLAHVDHHTDFQVIGGPGGFNPDMGRNSGHRPCNRGRFDEIAAGDNRRFLFSQNPLFFILRLHGARVFGFLLVPHCSLLFL